MSSFAKLLNHTSTFVPNVGKLLLHYHNHHKWLINRWLLSLWSRNTASSLCQLHHGKETLLLIQPAGMLKPLDKWWVSFTSRKLIIDALGSSDHFPRCAFYFQHFLCLSVLSCNRQIGFTIRVFLCIEEGKFVLIYKF